MFVHSSVMLLPVRMRQRPLEDIIQASTSSIPARRYGKPEEYADAVAFLASTRASYITRATSSGRMK